VDETRFCKVEDEGNIRIVTINRPEVLNALHWEAHEELDRVWNDFSANDGLWAAIVTGAGDRAFSAGNDLKVMADGKYRPKPESGFAGLTRRHDIDKPIIAAVNGLAMGGGFEIALSCDIIVAAEHAVFALPEPRVGMIAGEGGITRLGRMIPQKQALGMILTGRRVSAAEGERLGFVNEVVPTGEALAGALRWANLILEASPLAVRASKQAFYRGFDEPTLAEAISTIYSVQQQNMASQDYLEGPKAFAEKRKPVWQNK
jgi:enoyl-CoA hydratase/carnithine racemase